jgi:hypothetical protein
MLYNELNLQKIGGAGSSSILKTTEFITLDENSKLKIVAGPDMPEPLMYHSAAWISATKVEASKISKIYFKGSNLESSTCSKLIKLSNLIENLKDINRFWARLG